MVKMTWGLFHQRFMSSFYACRSQKREKTLMTWLSFFAFEIFALKSCQENVGEIDPNSYILPTNEPYRVAYLTRESLKFKKGSVVSIFESPLFLLQSGVEKTSKDSFVRFVGQRGLFIDDAIKVCGGDACVRVFEWVGMCNA